MSNAPTRLSQYLGRSGKKLNPRLKVDEWLIGQQQRLAARSHQEALYLLFHNLDAPPTCQWCMKQPASFKSFSKGYGDFCSVSCAFHGADKHQKKVERLLATEGIQNVFQRELVKNAISTKLSSQRASITSKSRETLAARYGVDHVFKLSSVRDKAAAGRYQKWIDRVVIPFLSAGEYRSDVLPTNSAEAIPIHHNVCGKTFLASFANGRFPSCPRCYSRSVGQEQVSQFFEDLGLTVRRNVRDLIPPYEIDVLAGNVAVEFNGDYWHSAAFHDASYLDAKAAAAEALGIKLIFVQENQWKNRQQQVKNRLVAAVGLAERIPARTCRLVEVSTPIAREFFEMHHLDGAPPPGSILKTFGLEKDGKLLMVMSIGPSRWYRQTKYEVVRCCTSGPVVIGGLSRLTKRIPESTVTYVDLNTGNGDGWKAAGWKDAGFTGHSYFWFNPATGERLSRYQAQPKKLSRRYKVHVDSEKAFLAKQGFIKIFTRGNQRLIR